MYSVEQFGNISFGIQLLSFFQYCVFAVMLILYPMYPSPSHLEKFFMKRRFPDKEYETLKKIVYALFPFFVFAFTYLMGEKMPGGNPLRIGANLEPFYYKFAVFRGTLYFTALAVSNLI